MDIDNNIEAYIEYRVYKKESCSRETYVNDTAENI